MFPSLRKIATWPGFPLAGFTATADLLWPAHRRTRLARLFEAALAARNKGAQTRKAHTSQRRCGCYPSPFSNILGKECIHQEGGGRRQPTPAQTLQQSQCSQTKCERLLSERRRSLSVPKLLCGVSREAPSSKLV